MINLCVDLKYFENDVVSQRNVYQLHHQQVFLDDEYQHEDNVCNMMLAIECMDLRKPSNEEIDKITAEMIAQVHSTYNLRNRTINNELVSHLVFSLHKLHIK